MLTWTSKVTAILTGVLTASGSVMDTVPVSVPALNPAGLMPIVTKPSPVPEVGLMVSQESDRVAVQCSCPPLPSMTRTFWSGVVAPVVDAPNFKAARLTSIRGELASRIVKSALDSSTLEPCVIRTR